VSQITRAHHTGLTVRSLERSVAFYRDVLGFEVAFAWNPQAPYIAELVGYPTVDLHAVILRIPGSAVFLELLEYRNVDAEAVDSGNANPGTAHIAFAVDDLDGLYADLSAKGVASLSPPVTPTIGPNKGGRAVYMIDPDGFRVELIQSSMGFGEYRPDDAVSSAPASGCC
jgi:catechol 2,3-dioxygenase-like lactoylglutathione lyase family enzyme